MSKVILDHTRARDLIGKKVTSLIVEANECEIVSAYISECDIFNDYENLKSLKIICNARSSSTNPFTLLSLLGNERIEVRSRSDIHAKVYIFPDCILITSANATPNGLGIGTIEAAALVTSEGEIDKTKDWFLSLWNDKGTEVVREFTKGEWDKLKSQWRISNNRNKRPKLIDLINTRSIPKNTTFCFWCEVNDAPSKEKVYTASSRQGVVELPDNIDKWDYWIEGSLDEIDIKSVNDFLKRQYSNICVNIKANVFPPTKVYKTEAFSSKVLDKAISYKYRRNKLLLTLYRTDSVKLPFDVDSEAIKLINDSLKYNKKAWEKHYKSAHGKLGYCTPEDLYSLVEKRT